MNFVSKEEFAHPQFNMQLLYSLTPQYIIKQSKNQSLAIIIV